jgi:hypothetical protein
MELRLNKRNADYLLAKMGEYPGGALTIALDGDGDGDIAHCSGRVYQTYSDWKKEYADQLAGRHKRYFLAVPRTNITEYMKANLDTMALTIDDSTHEITDLALLNSDGLKLARMNNGVFGHKLKTRYIHRYWSVEDLFGDEIMFCPVCGKSEFVKLEPNGSVWCSECNCFFTVRDTAGDEGVVIDCHLDHVEGYFLPEGQKFSFWQVVKDCNEGLNDRKRWCADLGGSRDHDFTRDKAVGVKKFYCTSCRKNKREEEM